MTIWAKWFNEWFWGFGIGAGVSIGRRPGFISWKGLFSSSFLLIPDVKMHPLFCFCSSLNKKMTISG